MEFSVYKIHEISTIHYTMDKLIYEVIPPPVTWEEEKTQEWMSKVFEMLTEKRVKTLNLPEVIDEARSEERVVPFIEKIDNLHFSQMVKKTYPSFQMIINKICVRLKEQELLDWAKNAERLGIQDIILVGKETDEIPYPGPSVTQAAALLKEHHPTLNLGGITIFTRRGEAERVLEKVQSGMDFFVSQIIFETSSAKRVLMDLKKLCSKACVKMPWIYLSFAPASQKQDIEFMQWLGVEFQPDCLSYFLNHKKEDISDRVFEVLDLILDEMMDFMNKEKYPIGFNVEQIMYAHIASGKDLIDLVQEKMEKLT